MSSIPINPKRCELWWSELEKEHTFFAIHERNSGWRKNNLPSDSKLEHAFQADNWPEAMNVIMKYLSQHYFEWEGPTGSYYEPIPEEVREYVNDGWPAWGWSVEYDGTPQQLKKIDLRPPSLSDKKIRGLRSPEGKMVPEFQKRTALSKN